jgi:hypothetical protein
MILAEELKRPVNGWIAMKEGVQSLLPCCHLACAYKPKHKVVSEEAARLNAKPDESCLASYIGS